MAPVQNSRYFSTNRPQSKKLRCSGTAGVFGGMVVASKTGTSDKAVGLRSAVHQYMGGSEIQTYSIMAVADCLGKLIAGLVTRLNQVQLRTASEQTRLLQLDTPGESTEVAGV
ncbi:TPA: hypothetical protein ACH3X1_004969 [Trebouxia sp. C0004]